MHRGWERLTGHCHVQQPLIGLVDFQYSDTGEVDQSGRVVSSQGVATGRTG